MIPPDHTSKTMPDKTSPPRGPQGYDNDKFIEWLKTQSADALLKPPDLGDLTEADKARHRVYLLLVMALVYKHRNGNKNGPVGFYNYRDEQLTGDVSKNGKLIGKLYDRGRPYLGHNIAAIAVDSTPEVVDFDFNHNAVFASSLEHAEARLIRRINSLAGLTTLKPIRDMTVYTTLEPCAQCAGIMALAGVKTVVYVQPDEGTRLTSNILFNLQPYSAMVRPITASDCDAAFGNDLHRKYVEFQQIVMNKNRPFGKSPFVPPFKSQPGVEPFGPPFFTDPETEESDFSTSIASFLCTDAAMTIFRNAAETFANLDAARDQNAAEAKRFWTDVVDKFNHRGTPH
jgi:tRNA(Arg) A34 adenosine deaminase TadA